MILGAENLLPAYRLSPEVYDLFGFGQAGP